MNVIHGHQNLTKGGLARNVFSRCNVLSDIVCDFLVGVVDVYRQPQQEVRQIKNRPKL
ncbi:hypothetical protein FOL01_1057 [Weissella jogaejeotgali]|uniref:Uncharacterized protein n=1 Tax=Weissella jogaejeotgali TaxID=1631871 RepID=A0A1L6RBL0_9LACO|nr:hypothetical protein FOL01_1057 [Weissella jogaejeotgali]